MTSVDARRLPPLAILRRVLACLWPYAWQYGGAILGIGLANLFINVFMGRIILDLISGLQRSSESMLSATTRNMAILGAFLVVWVFFSAFPLLKALYSFQDDVRRALFRKYAGMPLGELEKRHSGDLLTRSNSGLRQTVSMLMGDVQTLAGAIFSGLGCGAYMLMLDARMGVAGILCSTVPLLVSLPFADPLRAVGREVQERQATFTERVSDILRGSDTIRHLNLAEFATGRAGVASDDLRESVGRHVRLDSLRKLCDGASSLSNIAFMIYASYLAINDPSLAPAAVAMGQLASSVRFMFDNLGSVISNIMSNLGSAERILEVLDIPDEPQAIAAPQAGPLPPQAVPSDPQSEDTHPEEQRTGGTAEQRTVRTAAAHAALSVTDISFRYNRSHERALVGISFSTPRGKRIALVGPSGGGKSTLVKVVLGLYPPGAGEVLAFGRSIYETPLSEWRSLFSYVPQMPFLFFGTVYENILGGMDDPGGKRVTEAACLANAHDFIADMPGGYQANVSERGENLSGGQRQRIAIARAVLRNAPILLLDEATSSLDAESEALVQEALDRLMAGRTTLVVAHRLSTVREADEILYMAEGRILERGTHDELMDRGRLYKSLVEEGTSLGRRGNSTSFATSKSAYREQPQGKRQQGGHLI